MLFDLAYMLLRIVFFPFYRLKVAGRENLPPGGMLVCANHKSYKDPIFVVFAIGRKHPYAFMAKAELFKNPVSRFIMSNICAFPVNRGKSDIRAVKSALSALKSGKILLLFPEGTRKADAEVKSGAGMLAVRGGAPVVPVHITGGKRLFSAISVVIGKPFKVYAPQNPDYKEIANGIMQKVLSL